MQIFKLIQFLLFYFFKHLNLNQKNLQYIIIQCINLLHLISNKHFVVFFQKEFEIKIILKVK